jgi:hypothetical protein
VWVEKSQEDRINRIATMSPIAASTTGSSRDWRLGFLEKKLAVTEADWLWA